MKTTFIALLGATRSEFIQLRRSYVLVILTVIQAVTFLLLVSLFGLTGSRAPTALVDEDHGLYARMFAKILATTHHSFSLRLMDQAAAMTALQHGRLVAIIVIPHGFSEIIAQGGTPPIRVLVDNVDVDLTEDIQRALPSAIVAFGRQFNSPFIRVHDIEHDLINHDTGFIPYLVVSSLALDAFIIAGILSAIAVAREFESGTVKSLLLTPMQPIVVFIGRVLATDIVAMLALLVTTGVVIIGYGVVPVSPIEAIIALITCVVIFGSIGAMLGVLIKRTLPVASLIFGLALPLYMDSGSLEPERFDGNVIWILAHLSPTYPAVGVLEDAFHGLRVTPEPIFVDFLMLVGWACLMLILMAFILRRNVVR
jgi:ABC-2 type transport system permease protein